VRRETSKSRRGGFTLIELLVVVALLGLLAALIVPAAGRGVAAARKAACVSNLHQLMTAYTLYLDDHDGRFFRWREQVPDGTLWYWGLEIGAGGEGKRDLDMSRARLAPYLGRGGGVEVCPSMPYREPFFKRKFSIASYGYGINVYLLEDSPQGRSSGISRLDQIGKPSETIAWGDAIQINTFQAPASPANPMLEEWYALDAMEPQKYHFRHSGLVNTAMADGSVRSFRPYRLDPRCDGRSGMLEPPKQDQWLRTNK
jgi:prepilin-type N-terminal cleavage/methylation domain-containing protein/prepilin-type processing-associated H-X9-DG protein